MNSSLCTFVLLHWPTSLTCHSWRWQEGHISYSQLQNKCFSGIFGPFLSPPVICSSWIPPWRYHVAMWGEISSSHERCFPQVNYLWWKSLRRWSPSAIWALWCVLNIKGHSACLILLDKSAILIGGCKNLYQLISKKTTSLLFQVFICEGGKNKAELFLFFSTGV